MALVNVHSFQQQERQRQAFLQITFLRTGFHATTVPNLLVTHTATVQTAVEDCLYTTTKPISHAQRADRVWFRSTEVPDVRQILWAKYIGKFCSCNSRHRTPGSVMKPSH
jgi:hypothetical protein